MRFDIRHHTRYTYSIPVLLGPQTVRLRPRPDGGVRELAWDLKLDPEPQSRSDQLDAEGNLVTRDVRLLYSVGRGELRDLAIFDASGRIVRDLLPATLASPRLGEIAWDGRDRNGNRVPGGVYWARLGTSAGERTTRFVVIR